MSSKTTLQLQRLANLSVARSSGPAVCLVGHGVPPEDYPRERLAEFIRIQHSPKTAPAEHARLRELDKEIRGWLRTEKNDPYWRGLMQIAEEIRARGHYPLVTVAFNEFCGPTVAEAIDNLSEKGATEIVVVSTMIVPGGVHSEHHIKAEAEKAKQRHPSVTVTYAWPFDVENLAALLCEQVNRFSGTLS